MKEDLIYRIMEGFIIYKIGDVVEGKIIDFTHEGNGVLKTDDFIIFVKEALIGDEVKAKIDKVKKNYRISRLL